MDPSFGHWLAGLIDGEGCFAIGSQRPNKSGQTPCYCTFAIKVRADDVDMMVNIQQTLGIGRIEFEQRPAKTNGNAAVKWVVSDKDGCLRLVAFLDEFVLRSKKLRDYAIWRMAVSDWLAGQAGVARDWTVMMQLREQLMTGRKYSLDYCSDHGKEFASERV